MGRAHGLLSGIKSFRRYYTYDSRQKYSTAWFFPLSSVITTIEISVG